jgi:REP element-mobilizing transposase RayT/DNA-binding NarL/FixJ family response regulator
MPADILVVTNSKPTGDSIRQTMEETDLYRIHLATNKETAIVKADKAGIPLAMLDLSLGEDAVYDIGRALRTISESINLVIICDDKQNPPVFDSLRPWILVRKPFDMSDFLTAISRPNSSPTPATNESKTHPWLNDVTKAAQHLTRLTLESSSQAALITRKNDLWAYAGGLSQSAANEVAKAVTRNWDGQKGADLLRFIRLESTKAEHMLYATRLATDVVLALVFDAETPFSTIRSQASQLVNNLDTEKGNTQQLKAMQAEAEADEDIPQISDILKSVPSPNPSAGVSAPTRRESQPSIPREAFDPNQTRTGAPLSNAIAYNRNSPPVIKQNSVPMPVQKMETNQADVAFDGIDVSAPPVRPQQRPETPIARPVNSGDVTRESPTTEAARKLSVEPVSAGLYHLTYACLLVPRFSSHFITGDLSERMDEWLPNVCIAFGWRLEYLAVRPEYLQWVVNVQPNTSPGYLMRIMRQQTSEKIFTEFPRMKKENPSGDFWAPGYLIMGGTQPHPPQLVRDYIRQTRQRQGQEAPPTRG